MALIAQTNAPLTDVSGASDNSLNGSYIGAIAVSGSTLVVGAAVAGAPAIGAIGGIALASGLAYAGYCDDAGLDPMSPWGDDSDESSDKPETTDASVA